MKGFNNRNNRESVDVDVSASMATGVWLVDSDGIDDDIGNTPLLLVMAKTPEDAAQAYAARRNEWNQPLDPTQKFAVFPLRSTKPIAEGQLEDWSAFQDCFVQVLL